MTAALYRYIRMYIIYIIAQRVTRLTIFRVRSRLVNNDKSLNQLMPLKTKWLQQQGLHIQQYQILQKIYNIFQIIYKINKLQSDMYTCDVECHVSSVLYKYNLFYKVIRQQMESSIKFSVLLPKVNGYRPLLEAIKGDK